MVEIKWFTFECHDCDVPMEPHLKPGDRDVEVTCPECGGTYLASYPSEMLSLDSDAV